MSYLALTSGDRELMADVIGVTSVDELFDPIPEAIRARGLDLPPGVGEQECRGKVRAMAAANRLRGSSSFLGAGCYHHSVPAAVSALIGRGEFATAYTPYQAEASQGTLQAIFEFQTTVCELTGLGAANASMYDGCSAAAEAAFMALRQTKKGRIACSVGIHPETLAVLRTYSSGPDIPVDIVDLDTSTGQTTVPRSVMGPNTGVLIVQQPNFFGVIEDIRLLAQAAHASGALLVVVQQPVTFGILEAPGRLGADIAAGDLQPFGGPPLFGGSSVGYLACREQLVRQLPGRLVGQTLDADGRICYTLTLQAREQHIRRAKAASNICSNQALNALAATIHAALLGPVGLLELGGICVRRAHHLAEELRQLPGLSLVYSGAFFNEFALRVAGGAGSFASAMRDLGTDPGVPLGRFTKALDDVLLVAVTEVNTRADLGSYVERARTILASTTSRAHGTTNRP